MSAFWEIYLEQKDVFKLLQSFHNILLPFTAFNKFMKTSQQIVQI